MTPKASIIPLHDRSPVEADSGSDTDDCIGDVGFMFDNHLPKARRVFRFGDISVAVRLVDDDPGAVQSGHYVWPAAPALSAYLVDRQRWLPRGAVLELGAGCGLAGLVAAQLPSTTAIVFTDHDPGVLDLIQESIAEQERDPELGGIASALKCRCEALSWGPIGTDQCASLFEALADAPSSSPSHGGRGGDGAANTANESNLEGKFCGERKRDNKGSSTPTFEGDVNGVSGPQTEGPSSSLYTVASHACAARGPSAERGASVDSGESTSSGKSEAVMLDLAPGFTSTSDVELEAGLVGDEVQFDLLIASDVIYSVSVVKPLFDTVDGLLARGGRAGRGGGATGEGEGRNKERVGPHVRVREVFEDANGDGLGCSRGGACAASPVFIMSQSFGYDPETEAAIDRACVEHGLVRHVVWDELPSPQAHSGEGASAEEEKIVASQEEKTMTGCEKERDSIEKSGAEDCIRVEGGGDKEANTGRVTIASNSDRIITGDVGDDLDSSSTSQKFRAGTKLQQFWRA